MALMVQSANKGATKSQLMYASYLSTLQVNIYLDFLLEKELLYLDEDSQLYRMTEKGLGFLKAYREISDVLTMGKYGTREELLSAQHQA